MLKEGQALINICTTHLHTEDIHLKIFQISDVHVKSTDCYIWWVCLCVRFFILKTVKGVLNC